MSETLEAEIRDLRATFWSDRDPEGRAFAPLADACRRAGDLDEAAELVADGTDRLPGFVPGHVVAARVARDRGDLSAASEAYRRALELDPGNVRALRELADVAVRDGRDDEAVDLLHRVTVLEPADPAHRERLREAKRRCLAEELAAPEEPEEEAPAAAGDEPGPARAVAAAATEEAAPVSGPGESPSDPGLYTRTAGELYARQGHLERAVEVFERLVERNPGQEDLGDRLEELRAAAESATDPAGNGAAADGPPAPPLEDDGAEMETLARDWAAGPDETGELSTPFAWAETGADADEARASGTAAGPTIGEHFRRILAWRPATEDEEAAPAGADPTEGRSPAHETVPIEDLAPDPEAVPIESLAPDAESSGPDEDESSDDRDDDFRRWLEGLGE